MIYIRSVVVGVLTAFVSVALLLFGIFLPATYSIMATVLVGPVLIAATVGFAGGVLDDVRRVGRARRAAPRT